MAKGMETGPMVLGIGQGWQGRAMMRGMAAAMLAVAVPALSGCGSFFVYPGNGSTTTNSGDYVFVSNSTSGATYINGYSIGSGTLAATSGSPINVNVIPSAMVVTTNNGILYVGSCGATELSVAAISCDSGGGSNGIYAYAIGTAGALTALNSGAAVAGQYPVSLDVSPDGQWLIALDGLSYTITVYQINNSTGGLTAIHQATVSSIYTLTPYEVRVAPTGSYIAATFGAAGTIVIPFTTSNGTLGTSYSIPAPNNVSAYSLAMDSSNNLYIGGTGGTTTTLGVSVYQLGASAATQSNTSIYATGAGPRSMVLSSNYNYLYTGNQQDTASGATQPGDISEFSQSSAKLTSLGIPIGAPVNVYSMARDNSGNYILAAGYNATTDGMVLYSIGSTGALSASADVITQAPSTSGVSMPSVMALTH
jgi:6-phosphogluconolactonase